MKYLDPERLSKLDDAAFRGRDPYPWVNPAGLLTDAGYRQLRADLPPLEQMQASFGVQRKHGQKSHDRYLLEWEEGVEVPSSWKEFIAELSGGEYRAFLRRMLASNAFELAFHWHYAPQGCSISPHCDALRKLGSHIFYFNPDDWDPAWGGGTLVLDDNGRLDRRSAPSFEDFDKIESSDPVGNTSFLFVRRHNSWHGMRPLACPEGRLRKVFIVVLNRVTPLDRAKRLVGLGGRRGY